MADDFELKKVGYVAAIIGTVILVLGIVGVFIGLAN